MLPNRQYFCCDNLWKSIIMALEKPEKLRELFFSYFVAMLSRWGSISSPAGPLSLRVLEENLWWLVEWCFYGLNVLPATQPSVLGHWREHKALTLTSRLASSFLHSPLDFWWKGYFFLYAVSASPVPGISLRSFAMLKRGIEWVQACTRYEYKHVLANISCSHYQHPRSS